MSTILLTGCNGQIGAELAMSLPPLGRVITCDGRTLDLADPDAIVATMREIRPSIIVNAAAYTAVDRAESEPALAHAVNATAPAVLADEAARLGALLVHYSTDYVFDGAKPGPYNEDDAPNPLNVYGRSKLAGEKSIQESGADYLIFRTSWVYGARGTNFLLTMLKLAVEREELKVVNDQIGAPTWSRDIARVTAAILSSRRDATDRHRLFHLSAAGGTTWFDFAATIFEIALNGKPRPRLVPIPAAEYPVAARRPHNSLLNNDRLRATFDFEMPRWDASLRTCIEAMANA